MSHITRISNELQSCPSWSAPDSAFALDRLSDKFARRSPGALTLDFESTAHFRAPLNAAHSFGLFAGCCLECVVARPSCTSLRVI